jgi:hypothetical protein
MLDCVCSDTVFSFLRTGGAYAPTGNILKKKVQTKLKQKQQQKGELKLKKERR